MPAAFSLPLVSSSFAALRGRGQEVHIGEARPGGLSTLKPALLFFALAGLAGCDHSVPFSTSNSGSSEPFQAGSPRRLTYNVGQDRSPAWLPDELGLIYSYERTDRPDHDRCLGLLPPNGGQRTQEICELAADADDSTNVLTEPAVDATGRLAYVATSSGIAATAPIYASLRVSSLTDPGTTRVLVNLPLFTTVLQPRWLGRDTLVYLAARVGYSSVCRGCPVDTLETGVAIELLDASAPTPQPQMLAGTANASSVAAGAAGFIYYTLNGDTRVFRYAIASGSAVLAFDFGAAGIARDVQVTGSRLVAIVGGNVSFVYDSTLGYEVQRDGGGALHVVDLTSRTDMILAIPGLSFRRPALSPSGTRLVVEARAGGASDLWEVTLP